MMPVWRPALDRLCDGSFGADRGFRRADSGSTRVGRRYSVTRLPLRVGNKNGTFLDNMFPTYMCLLQRATREAPK